MQELKIKRPQSRRLAVFLDGTWNSVSDNTNVWRMKCLCAGESTDGREQKTYYDTGLSGVLGGTFAKGMDLNIIEAYQWLVDNYLPGDEIFIFGFSRGAYTARSLAGFITICGLLKAGAALGISQLFERYKLGLRLRTVYQLAEISKNGRSADFSIEEHWMVKYCHLAPIKCVCVWDTVGYVGIPIGSIKGVSRQTFTYLHTGLRLPIENGYHALAIDEHRAAFRPTLWTVKKLPGRDIRSVEQRWFIGAHANVGGGCQSDFLAQYPLRWMMRKASSHGLTFTSDIDLDGSVTSAPIHDSYDQFLRGAYKLYRRTRYRRPIDGDQGVSDGTKDFVINETIDRTVFERYNEDHYYRPLQLEAWARKYSIDLRDMNMSVRANAPSTAVPD